ncbi:helix-turn-helix transcriptional regulator [Pseudoflavonifractor sp. P01025]|uniref:helix-turn-helix transcriptional regulator n=1 Tax=Flintibacter porci TaxID=3342383 RepID=UPI0035B62033
MDRKSPIKAMRKSHGLSQEQLAKMLGISRSTVAKYELGDIDPPMRVLGQMATIFRCSLDDLVDVQEHMGFQSKEDANTFTDVVNSVQTALMKSDNRAELFDGLASHLLLDAFGELNDAGKTEAVKLLYKLAANPKYQRKPEEGDPGAVDPKENE